MKMVGRRLPWVHLAGSPRYITKKLTASVWSSNDWSSCVANSLMFATDLLNAGADAYPKEYIRAPGKSTGSRCDSQRMSSSCSSLKFFVQVLKKSPPSPWTAIMSTSKFSCPAIGSSGSGGMRRRPNRSGSFASCLRLEDASSPPGTNLSLLMVEHG